MRSCYAGITPVHTCTTLLDANHVVAPTRRRLCDSPGAALTHQMYTPEAQVDNAPLTMEPSSQSPSSTAYIRSQASCTSRVGIHFATVTKTGILAAMRHYALCRAAASKNHPHSIECATLSTCKPAYRNPTSRSPAREARALPTIPPTPFPPHNPPPLPSSPHRARHTVSSPHPTRLHRVLLIYAPDAARGQSGSPSYPGGLIWEAGKRCGRACFAVGTRRFLGRGQRCRMVWVGDWGGGGGGCI